MGLRLQLARSEKGFRPTIPTIPRPQEKSWPLARSFSTGRRRLHISALSLFVGSDFGKRTPLQKHRRRDRLDYGQRDLVSLTGRLLFRRQQTKRGRRSQWRGAAGKN